MRARMRCLTVMTLAVTMAGSCGTATDTGSASSADPGAKVGGRSGPITITVADSQPTDRPSNLPLAEFKRQVETLSGGSMTVTVLTGAVDDVTAGSDAAVIDRLKAGTYQMAVVPARAWSAVGVTSMKALQAPFLFESNEHVAAVVDDPAIRKDLFSGFDGSGVTGLTLFPESLRHLLSFGAPMLTPADVKGRTIRAISSIETTAIIEALGGTAVDPVGDAYQQGVDAGTIQGTDSGFPLSAGAPNQTATATGNVALYAKIITLVINSALWTSLDAAQRAIITMASDATRAWAIGHQVKDADAAIIFCGGGGTVVLTDTPGVAAFRAAEAPVYAALETDPATKRVIDAIRALAPGTSAAVVKACQPETAVSTFLPAGGGLPNGIYRAEYTDEYLKKWGLGVSDVKFNHGVWTYTLEDGHWAIDQLADDATSRVGGAYRVTGRDLFWRWDNDPGQPVEHLTWSVDRRGDLILAPAPGTTDFWTFAIPLARVGDIPH